MTYIECIPYLGISLSITGLFLMYRFGMIAQKEAFRHPCERVEKSEKKILREKFWHMAGVLLAILGIVAFLIVQILLLIL